MIKILKNIKQYFKKLKFAKDQKKNLTKKGTLLHVFSKKKQIFIHIPKTAGISVVKAFFGDVTLEGHRSVYFYKQVFGQDLSNFFTFTFVRNPWDRLYSAYKFLQKGGINIHDKNAFDMYLSEYNDFEDFVLNGLNEKILCEITHFIPQFKFVCDKNGAILVDYIAKFEDIENEILELNSLMKTKVKFEYHNVNIKKSYTEIYSPEMIEVVKRIYKKDIDIFEYCFK